MSGGAVSDRTGAGTGSSDTRACGVPPSISSSSTPVDPTGRSASWSGGLLGIDVSANASKLTVAVGAGEFETTLDEL